VWTFFYKKKKNLFFSIFLLSITKISDCQFLTGGNDIVADLALCLASCRVQRNSTNQLHKQVKLKVMNALV
jgi:hypothetical protein